MSSVSDFGIYFGGSSLVIAFCRDGRSEIIVNEAGDRQTPAVVAINDDEILTGLSAKQNIIRNAENTIVYGKYLIGNSTTLADDGSNMEEILKKTYCQIKIDNDNDHQLRFQLTRNDKPFEFKLTDVIEYQFKYLHNLAKTSLGIKDDLNLVLSVPLYFNKQQADVLVNCATNIGFNVQRVIHNPFAACLAYDIEDDNSANTKALVYQMGSSSLELTLVDCINGLYRKLDTIFTFQVGGDHFTDIVVNILCDEFKRKNKQMDPRDNKRSLFKLKSNAEYLKSILSTMERAHCSIDALYEGIDFDYHITRQRFEGACTKTYEKCLNIIDQLLDRNDLTVNHIDKVILCGAATKMCKLQQLVKDKFPSNCKLLNQISPDECIALGCAKQSNIIANSKLTKFTAHQDCSFKAVAHEIFMRVSDDDKSKEEKIIVIPKHTPIPVKRRINVNINEPFAVYVYEDLKADKQLIKIPLDGFTTREISCLFQIKFDGTLEMSITELSTNKTITEYLNTDS